MKHSFPALVLSEPDALQAEVDALKHLPPETAAELDAAALTACGFNARKDLPAQLLALNQAVAARIERGEPVTAPGVPTNYPKAKKLVTEDRIPPMGLAAAGRSAG